MSEPVLQAKQLTLRFGGFAALDAFSLDVQPEEIHGLIGPNGAGKTTSFDVITGVYRPHKGSVWLAGRDITRWRPQRRTRAGIGRSFQTVGLAPGLTSRGNVLATVEAVEKVWAPFPLPASARRRRAQADELLEFFGLDEVADTQVTDLPLGTTKLLELAKVFAGSPKVVLLDEPFAGLSTAEARERVRLISERRKHSRAGVVIVEHDVPLLLDLCDTLTVLDTGAVVVCGPPHEVMSDPAVREAYMGDVVEESTI
jgi:ABC-type branched-subunit amino acid transport system ATPase component